MKYYSKSRKGDLDFFLTKEDHRVIGEIIQNETSTGMNSKQFFEAVVKMRQLQTEYYKTRSSLALRAAKKQEQLIDDEIERVQRVLKIKEEQPDLFSV